MKCFRCIAVILAAIVARCQLQPLAGSKDSLFNEDSVAEEEVPQFNVEQDLNVAWNDNLMDSNTKEFKGLEKTVKDMINNVGNPDFQFQSLESFRKTDDNKVRAKAIVMLRIPKSFHRTEKESQDDLTRIRRISIADLTAGLAAAGASDIVVSTTGKIGTVCDDSQANMQCTAENAVCLSGICGCSHPFIIIGDNIDKCFEKKNLGEPCEEDKQCTLGSHQECSTNCVCIIGFFEATDQSGNSGCYEERSNLGEACTIPEQCDTIPYATCPVDSCVCGNNYMQDGNDCVGTVALGDVCTDDSECSAEFSECPSSSNTCSCSDGYNQTGDTCVLDDKCSTEDTSSCKSGEGNCVNVPPTWKCECSFGFSNPEGNLQTCQPDGTTTLKYSFKI